MYLDKVKARVEELHIIRVEKMILCTEQEIRALEQKIGSSLPVAYQEFLLWMSRRSGGLLRGENWLYEHLEDIQLDAIELMRRDGFPVTLPADAFVFLMHEGYHFAFFRTSEGDDPPVYEYIETDAEIALKISSSHYSDFLLDVFEQEAKLIESMKG